ncbi:MAG: GNAT family N-acetyltransferase [Arenicellales bacterium]
MTHVLDRPPWSSLTTQQAALAEGGTLARRFPPAIAPFAAARDTRAGSLAALAQLPGPGETMLLLDADPIVLPAGLAAVLSAKVAQMTLVRPPEPMHDARIERLDEADAEEMLALATLTKPGPFTLKAQALGEFFGIRIDGRIAAMAGERMKMDGHAELSGVCSHPDFRGRGLARVLSLFVMQRILDRGETPFLHAWTTNTPAIRLYETIGFEVRAELNAAMVRKVE